MARRTNTPRQKPETVEDETPTVESAEDPAKTPDVESAAPETVIEEAAPSDEGQSQTPDEESATNTEGEGEAPEDGSADDTEDRSGDREVTVKIAAFSYQVDGRNVTALKGDTITVSAEMFERGKHLEAFAD